jgi:glycosyltransferase involved in cell wall biosynthesis
MQYSLSIITVNLNNANGLRKTIESVLIQTYKNYEFIIVDGGSTNESLEVIKEFNSKITFWISEADSGIYNGMNKGLKIATGEYCLFLNSGDYLENPEIIEKIFSSKVEQDFIYGDIIFQNDRGQMYITSLPEKLSLLFFYTSSLWHQATLIKRELFGKYGGYNENNKLVSDWEFFVQRIILDNCSYKKIDLVVTHYDMYNGLSVKNNELRLKELKESSSRLIPKYTIELLDDYLKMERELNEIKKSTLYRFNRKFAKLKKHLRGNG